MSKSSATYARMLSKVHRELEFTLKRPIYSVDTPPGTMENRVFIGGNYALMPVLREIERIIHEYNYQPVIAYDFNIPKENTREYTLRLLNLCRVGIFEVTLSNGHLVELARTTGFPETKILQVYMALDQRKDTPKTMSVMVWQSTPPPVGYVTFDELEDIVLAFLSQKR